MPTAAEELTAALAKSDLPDSVKHAIEKAQERETALAKATEGLTKATESVTELTAKVQKLEKAAGTPNSDEDEDDLSKADLPEPVRKALQKAAEREQAATERLEKAEKAASEAEQLAKAERDARQTAEFVQKAEGYKGLSIEAAKFGPILKSAAEKLTKDEVAELDRVLKAADEAIVTGELFKQQGRDGAPPAADSAIAEVQRKAEELKKADPQLSESQALDKAMTSDRGLQERYLTEVRGG
jgi:hypothetical protein